MTQINLNEYTVLDALPGVLCNNVWPGLFPGTEAQHSKSAIGNGTIARLHLFRRFFFRRHEHGQQRRKQGYSRGNLGQDPEVRYMPNGGAVATLRWLLPNPGVIKPPAR